MRPMDLFSPEPATAEPSPEPAGGDLRPEHTWRLEDLYPDGVPPGRRR